jgi:hypothetical protein
MTKDLFVMTLIALAVPFGFAAACLAGHRVLAGPLLFVCAIYAWIWVRFRPTRFEIRPDALEIVWPLKRRELPRQLISSVALMDRAGLRQQLGWGARIGAGGLWGAFGWLWSSRRGLVNMYISRTDRFVWLECSEGRPWLLTPEDAGSFVRELSERR